jgi:hypothetical protein
MSWSSPIRGFASTCLLSLAIAPLLVAQNAPAQSTTDDLAKQLSNPVSSLISLPFQYNADFGYDPEDGIKHTLNVQPVYPASISQDCNLITRVILPIVSQDDVFGTSSQFGLSDTVASFFFSPKAPTAGGWIYGVGPALLLPTATDDLLGTEKFGAGPTAVALKQTDAGWTYGALVNHIWSVAGDDDRVDVSSTFLQPFLSKQLSGGRTLSVNTESSYDWKSEQWTVPINFSYSKVTKIGGQLISFAGGARVYADAPDRGPDWGLRFAATLLFPK